MNNLKIKRAKKQDARKILFLIKDTYRKVNMNHPKEDSRQVEYLIQRNNMAKVLNLINQTTFFILLKGKRLIGTIHLEKDKIGGLYIRASEIKKGYGKLLLDFIETYAKKKGVKKARLYPTKTAYKFYSKYGYIIKAKHRYKTDTGLNCISFEMEKKLK